MVYRQLLVQGVLAILLPTEDLENDCLTAIVGQIFSEMIMGGTIGGKASEPWLLWEGIAKATEVIKDKLHNKSNTQLGSGRPPTHSVDPATSDKSARSSENWRVGLSIQKIFWAMLQYVFLTLTAARFLVAALASSTHLPSRVAPATKLTGSKAAEDEVEAPSVADRSTAPNSRCSPSKQPILKMKIWSCASALLDLSVRMPWLGAAISMLQWAAITGPGEVGNTDGMIDK